MNKTNSNKRVVYGVSYKNHGRWTTPSNMSIFTKTQVKQLSGQPKNSPMERHLAAFTDIAAWDRKQPARIVKIVA